MRFLGRLKVGARENKGQSHDGDQRRQDVVEKSSSIWK